MERKGRVDTSLQEQTPLSQAQNSVHNAHNAVTQAQSHPSEQLIEQAQTAVERAQTAVDQAAHFSHNRPAVQQAQADLAEDQAALSSLENDGFFS